MHSGKSGVEALLDRYYPLQPNGVRYLNGTTPFYDLLLHSLNPATSIVLNLGAGPTPEANRSVRGKVKRLVGVDPDPVVLTNSDLDEAYVNDGTSLPFSNGKFDAVYSDWVAEHVKEPLSFLQEVVRVLKPGGTYFFRTVNLFHYVTVISALTPYWFHRLVANRVRGLPKDVHEPWPTLYRMNTAGRIEKFCLAAGFERCEIRMFESSPSYLMFSPLFFKVGVAYERLVNKYDRLAVLRQIMYVKAVKPK